MQRRYAEQMTALWNSKILEPLVGEHKPVVEPSKKDKRFRDEAWEEQPFFDMLKQSYLINAKFLRDFVDNADVEQIKTARTNKRFILIPPFQTPVC